MEEVLEKNRLMEEALEEAKKSTCSRRLCGSVITKDGKIIGRGYNSPPANKENHRRCNLNKENYHKKITDKTCCVHAEQRAIIDALKNNPTRIQGSDLYFASIGKDGKIVHSEEPYCTICSKMALDVGIANFILWHKEGIKSYNTEEYNIKSYEYVE